MPEPGTESRPGVPVPSVEGTSPPGTSAGRRGAPAEALVHESRIQVPYTWSAGETLTRFFKALRDSGAVMATRCPRCRKAYCPPRRSCGTCFEDCSEWVEVGPEGVLVSVAQALYESPAHPRPRPVFGLVKLDGADTAMLHLIGEAGGQELRPGLRVEAVWSQERRGSILDIMHFKPSARPSVEGGSSGPGPTRGGGA